MDAMQEYGLELEVLNCAKRDGGGRGFGGPAFAGWCVNDARILLGLARGDDAGGGWKAGGRHGRQADKTDR